MPAVITEPEVVEHGPYCVVGAYATFEGEDEGPAWEAAWATLEGRLGEVTNRVGDAILGFLYRPHRDDPTVPQAVRACFVGVEVTDLASVPEGMAATRFSGGRFAAVRCVGGTEDESAAAVGDAVALLERWVAERGWREGDSCFCFSRELEPRPPFVEHVHLKIEEVG